MKKYYIFAGSYDQFQFYIRDRNINPKEAVYVYSPKCLRGICVENAILIKYGTWCENKLAGDILEEMKRIECALRPSLKPLSCRTGGPLDCRLAFRASVPEKRILLNNAKKQGLSLGEYVLALHRYYQGENK